MYFTIKSVVEGADAGHSLSLLALWDSLYYTFVNHHLFRHFGELYMKKTNTILYIAIAILALAVLLYFFVTDSYDDSERIRFFIVSAGIIASLVKVFLTPRKQAAERRALCSHVYEEFVTGAFEWDSRLEKRFYSALEEYNSDRPATALKKLAQLRAECRTREDVYGVTIFEALCLSDMQSHQKAAEKYADALAIRPLCTLASNMGMCYERMGNTEQAAECYSRAISIDPKNPLPHINLAFQSIRLGEIDAGREHAQHALDLAPGNPKALKAMTICCYMLGDADAYQSYYRRAVANGVDKEEVSIDYMEALAERLGLVDQVDAVAE